MTEATESTFFGHPKGLSTLFYTEMWERFSYYGMRALLTLFMTTSTIEANPGLGFDVATATAIYGLYTGLVYLLALPGGWIADNLWGQRKAIWVGGWIIAAGHFTMAVPTLSTFFLGLILITIGTGLLKPNVSTIVGDLYPEGGAARDAGFSVFYMGINLGAMAGPFITSFLGEGYHWHWGFGAAGVGMVAGLIQYRMGERHLGEIGHLRTDDTPEELERKSKRFFGGAFALVVAIVAFGFLVSNGTIPLTITQVAAYLGVSAWLVVLIFFVYLWTLGGHTAEENKRLGVIFWLFIMIAVFWSGFEQAGTSLNLFARDFTSRSVLGLQLPAGWFQSINAGFIIIMAPLFAMLWLRLDRMNANPSLPVKAGLGLLGLASGFFVIAWGAANAGPDNLASPAWLVVMYYLHTVGELCISPIGLSAITKLSPVRRVGQMMGVWFVGTALGNVFAGLVGGLLQDMAPGVLFRTVAMITGAVGITALLASPVVKGMMGGRD